MSLRQRENRVARSHLVCGYLEYTLTLNLSPPPPQVRADSLRPALPNLLLRRLLQLGHRPAVHRSTPSLGLRRPRVRRLRLRPGGGRAREPETAVFRSVSGRDGGVSGRNGGVSGRDGKVSSRNEGVSGRNGRVSGRNGGVSGRKGGVSGSADGGAGRG